MSIDFHDDALLKSPYATLMERVLEEAARSRETDADAFHRWLISQGYWCVRQLPTGEWAAGYDYLYTYGVLIGLQTGMPHYRTRWCYPKLEFSRDQVADFIRQWDGEGAPPGFWLKQKPEDKHHPEREEAKWDRQ